MVTKRKQHSSRRPVKQGRGARAPRPNKIGAATPYHFRGKNLTPYGGLLPVATLLEKLGFQALLEETITNKRITRVMSLYQFVLALVLGLYVGFARLNQLRFIARDPILTGILQVTRLPPQSTLWRFLASLHLNVAKQILSIQRQLRERVWAAAQVKLETGRRQRGQTRATGAADERHRVRATDAATQKKTAGRLPRAALELPRCWQQHCPQRGLTALDSTLRGGGRGSSKKSSWSRQECAQLPPPPCPPPLSKPSILSERRSSPCSLPFSARTDFRLILGLENAGGLAKTQEPARA